MQTTPNANRKHITIFGNTNTGKSSLLNVIIGQDISIVSAVKGTTTDPVIKAMELIPFGPVVFTDTAGLDDTTTLGEIRIKRTRKLLQSTDFAIYILDASSIDKKAYDLAIEDFKKYSIPYITVINKIDAVSKYNLDIIKNDFKDAVLVSAYKNEGIPELKDKLVNHLDENDAQETIVGDILKYGSKVIMVVPVDSEAPKGRLILPQVQLLRDCLDHGIKSYVVRDIELVSALEDIKDVDLVVTDSQAFKFVNSVVPPHIKLTGFSILFARYKGDLKKLVDGVKHVKKLVDGSLILIAESCTHNHSHEDIGRVKIPKLLKAYTKKDLIFEFKMGQDFPENLSEYDLVIHCGSCMLNKKIMQTRIDMCDDVNVNITNYGITLAYLNGSLDRTLEIFNM